MKVNNWVPYVIGGIGMWYFMLNSGIHATIAGVLLAFVIPFGDGSEKTISYRMQHLLHKPVAFIVLPLFALANTAVIFGGDWMEGLTSVKQYRYLFRLSIWKTDWYFSVLLCFCYDGSL